MPTVKSIVVISRAYLTKRTEVDSSSATQSASTKILYAILWGTTGFSTLTSLELSGVAARETAELVTKCR